MSFRNIFLGNALLVGALIARPTASQEPARYELSVPSPGSRLFHMKAEFPAAGNDTVYLSLPAWSPGSYEIQDYARYVRHFGARDAAGRTLFWDRADKDTWRVAAGRTDRVTVEFDYLGDSLDLSLSRLEGDFGVLLGTNVFLFEEGQLSRPAEVRFALPDGWRVTSVLGGAGAGPYAARDYHELADAVTFVGRYSLDSLPVDGRWIRVAVWPAEAYTPRVAQNLRDAVTRLAQTQNRIMGGPPYERYTIFFNAVPRSLAYAGGLEHSFSQFDILPGAGFADEAGNLGDFVRPLMSHEFFHLWNVKRIRPAELWPYDYHAEQYTPLLWWSEGVTDYYGDVTLVRSGLWSVDDFLSSVETNIGEVEDAPEPWSEEDGSVATWITEVYVNSSQLYYNKGSLTGLLLDIAIRDATDNAKSLDDVMRALLSRFFQQGRGFTTSDLIGLLREFGLPGAQQFYQRYVNGREPLPYDSVFPKAGLVVTRRTRPGPCLGISAGVAPDGRVIVFQVVEGSTAAEAGVQEQDVVVRLDDQAVSGNESWNATCRQRTQGRAGTAVALTVRRGREIRTLMGQVRPQIYMEIDVAPAPNPTAKQGRIWNGIVGR